MKVYINIWIKRPRDRNKINCKYIYVPEFSAGIGRTGTYIALDILLDQMDTTGRVDVMKAMKQMRDQRKGAVQTKV